MTTTSMQFGQSTIDVVLNEGQFPARITTDANGNTVLLGGGGEQLLPMQLVGMAHLRTSAETLVPTATFTKVLLDVASIDTLGVHDAVNGILNIPSYVNYIEVAGSLEWWKESTGFGSALGTYRRVSIERYPSGLLVGATPLVMPPSQTATIGVNVSLASGVIPYDNTLFPAEPNGNRALRLVAIQDSGVNCKVGGSGGAQTWLSVKMYI